MNSRLVAFADRYLQEYLEKIEIALAPLGDDQLWWRPADSTNSLANLLAHLHGNLSQWLLAGVGGLPFARRRGAEFAARGGATKAELLDRLRAAVEGGRGLLSGLTGDELARPREIQGYTVDGYAALFHVVEHFSYHTGQIVLLAKLLGAQVDFYPQHRDE